MLGNNEEQPIYINIIYKASQDKEEKVRIFGSGFV